MKQSGLSSNIAVMTRKFGRVPQRLRGFKAAATPQAQIWFAEYELTTSWVVSYEVTREKTANGSQLSMPILCLHEDSASSPPSKASFKYS